MSQLVGYLANSGQPHNLMCPNILMWESITTAGIQIQIIMEASGATPLIQIGDSSTALSQYVMQHTTVKEVIRWVSLIQES